MCVALEYDEHPENGTISWNYQGGCFADGSFAHYEPAVDGETYDFNFIPIEIREGIPFEGGEDDDSTDDERKDGGFFNLIGTVCFLSAIGLLCFMAWVVYLHKQRQ